MKFVGKFRKNKDYKDDYSYAKEFLNVRKSRIEHPEIKAKNQRWEEKAYDEPEELYDDEHFEQKEME